MPEVTQRKNLIVVGVDGSPGSDAALGWAIEEAKVRGAQVRAVYAWGYPAIAGPEGSVVYLDPLTLAIEARTHLDGILDVVLREVESRDRIERAAVEGGAANALIDQSKDADLLVVGARGHGGFLGLLIGSVSNQVVHHAPCPVVVVPKN